MKYNKPPLSINNQIVKLKSKGLNFLKLSSAKKFLTNINYYRLSSYFFPFYKKRSRKFKKSTTFSQISELYEFDNKLRSIIFESIQKIEISIRSRLINNYSIKYGSHWYTKLKLFKEYKDFTSFQSKALKAIDENGKKEKFITHYTSKYDEPSMPANWMIIELMTFGQLSQLYKSLRNDKTKKNIAKDFGVTELVLESWLHNINYTRNICAHHIRLWNRNLRITPKNPRRVNYQFLNNKTGFSHDKLYFTLSILIYLLKRIEVAGIQANMINEFIANCPESYRQNMGFPDNYKDEPLWN